MSRQITGTLLDPLGTALTGTLTLTALYNAPGASGVPRRNDATIAVAAGAYDDNVELGTYVVDFAETGGNTERLGIAVIPAGAASDLLTLIADSVIPDGTDVTLDSLSVAALTVTASATFAGATIANLGTVSAATSIVTSALVAATADINGGTWQGTIDGNWTAASQTCADLGTVTTADINGGTWQGTIDGPWTALGQTCANLGTVSAATSITTSALVAATADIDAGTWQGTIDGPWTALGQTCANLGTVSAATSIVTTDLTVSGAFTSQGIDDNADATAITIDSSENVGIGAAPPTLGKLHVEESTDATLSIAVRNTSTGTAAIGRLAAIASGSGISLEKVNPSYVGTGARRANIGLINDSGGQGIAIAAANAAGEIELYTGGNAVANLRATLDSAGNLGLGVIPESGWAPILIAMQIGGLGSLSGLIAASGGSSLNAACNYYNDGQGKYLISGEEASRYTQANGVHTFQVAASGTADTAISWTDALTIANDGGISAPNIKTGTTQVAAGAAAGDLWADSDDGYSVKLGV